jgi:PBP superfamily domain
VGKKRALVRMGVLGAAAVTLPLVASGQAFADYQPQPGDIVGVGGDTPQYALDFLINGDTSGDAGFNASATVNRVVPFDATADSNGRAAYANGSTESNPIPLDPTDVLRAGTYPVERVQSSGTAITALLNDDHTGSAEVINYVASTSAPTTTQGNTAYNEGFGGLHYIEFGTDAVELATDTTTNAPTLSTADLLAIYDGTDTTWTQVGGTSSAAIIPELPPTGSAVYKTFIGALNSQASGGTTTSKTGPKAFTLGTDVVTVEQNDPTAITGNTSSANAIVPFSEARYNLWASGYFHTPTVLPGGSGYASLSPGIELQTGTGSYSTAVKDYIIFRQSDVTYATALEPGGSLNWVRALFYNPGHAAKPWIETPAATPLIEAAGVTPAYVDEGEIGS